MLYLNGTLSCRPSDRPNEVLQVDVPGRVQELCCRNDRVLILLADNGAVYSRSRVSSEWPAGVGWQRLDAPGEVVSMTLDPQGRLWILTRAERLFYLHAEEGKRTPTSPRWWQVPLPANQPLSTNSSIKWLNISSVFKRRGGSQFMLAATESRIFLALAGSSVLLTAHNVTGIFLHPIVF